MANSSSVDRRTLTTDLFPLYCCAGLKKTSEVKSEVVHFSQLHLCDYILKDSSSDSALFLFFLISLLIHVDPVMFSSATVAIKDVVDCRKGLCLD